MNYIGSVGASANTTSYSMTIPDVLDDDVMFLFVAHTDTVTLGTISPACDSIDSVHQGGLLVEYFSRVMSASDSNTTLTVPTLSGTSKTAMAAIFIRGLDPANPIGVSQTSQVTANTRSSPAITLTSEGPVLTCITERSNGGTTSYTPPSGVTLAQSRINTGGGCNNLALGYIDDETPGPIGPFNWTFGGAQSTSPSIGISLGLAPATIVSPPSGPTVQFLDDALVSIVSIQYLNEEGILVDIVSWKTSDDTTTITEPMSATI